MSDNEPVTETSAGGQRDEEHPTAVKEPAQNSAAQKRAVKKSVAQKASAAKTPAPKRQSRKRAASKAASGGSSAADQAGTGPPETKPSSGLPDLVVDADAVTPTAHLVVEGGGTDHIAPPRVFPRHLPPVNAWELARRGNAIATIGARHFGPLVLRQLRQIRRGPFRSTPTRTRSGGLSRTSAAPS